MTSIYFLLLPGQVSRLHRLKSDEIWYFHAGDALVIHTIDEKGNYEKLSLGNDISVGQRPQQAVIPGVWFGATLQNESQPALVSCAVAPGFAFADFELAQKELLLQQFPQHHKIISRLT
jgi:predicted cupin superfamily sugar epimerase